MAGNEIKVPIIAELQMEKGSLQSIERALNDTLSKAGSGTTLAKNLTASLTKIRPLLREYEQLQLQPQINQSSLRRMDSIFNTILNEYNKHFSEIEFMSPEAMLPESALTRLKELRNELAQLKKDMSQIEKTGATGKTEDHMKAKPERQQLHEQAQAVSKKYRGEATLSENAKALEQEATSAQAHINSLEAESKKIAQNLKGIQDKLVEANSALQTAQANFDASKSQLDRAKKAKNASNFVTMLGGLSLTEDKKNGVQVRGWSTSKENIAAFTQQNGTLQGSYQNTLRSYLQEHLGVSIEDSMKVASASFEQIPTLLAQLIKEQIAELDTTTETYSKDLLRGNERWLQKARRTIDTGGHVNVHAFEEAAEAQHKQATVALNGAQKTADSLTQKESDLKSNQEQNRIELTAAKQTAEALSMVSSAFAEVARTAKEAAAALKQEAIDNKAAEVNAEKEKVTSPVRGALQSAGDPGQKRTDHTGAMGAEGGIFDQASQAQRDADAFKNNVKNTITRWFGAYQVINKVRQGIRQAWIDIQGLDKAMTNIAVVTDMSVGDLWGKINDYMSLAQQYGVTTQGVYEVSQLYYQQGLGTSDVMAATTETLKMARIAGMDYAEAADAMTVAIRSFKMEMTDAAHVTDVYSKVAAVTASDSEELAIAMSKTASSAESVGSSFENTTAMLAVMIETTRESAQNLGSALKSIISRYGEMKSGMTQDEDGELIDYNKTDAALRSVGISLKDAQGQFRDFDEVIFELSEKWDTLDKNTQRYIATVMAGNRQQSRFIALVDNWERLEEVSGEAKNSEDAGLLQYAKTMDSMETKLNNIKTSFQQFYMSVLNGDTFKGILDFVNSFLQGLNKLGTFQGLTNIITAFRGIKTALTGLGGLFSNTFGGLFSSIKAQQQQMLGVSANNGYNAGYQYGANFAKGEQDGRQGLPSSGPVGGGFKQNIPVETETHYANGVPKTGGGWQGFTARRMKGDGSKETNWGKNSWNGSKLGSGIAVGGRLAGAAFSIAGTAIADKNPGAGAIVSGLGSAAQGASMGAMLGPWGAAAGLVLGALSGLPAVLKEFSENTKLERTYEEAKAKADDANIKRAEAKENYNSMSRLIDKVRATEENKNSSEENYQAWIDANNALVEKYPALLDYIDEYGNTIADLTNTSGMLEQAMKDAAEASRNYYKARQEEIRAEINKYGQHEYWAASTTIFDGGYTRDVGMRYLDAGFFNFNKTANGFMYKNDVVTDLLEDGVLQFAGDVGWGAGYKTTNSKAVATKLNAFLKESRMSIYDLVELATRDESKRKNASQEALEWADMLGIMGFFNTNYEGATGVSEDFLKVMQLDSMWTELQATSKAGAQSNLMILSGEMEEAEDFAKAEGFSELMYTYGKNKGYTDQQLIDMGASTFNDEFKDFFKQYNSLSIGRKNIVDSLYGNLPSLSLVDLQDILTKQLDLTADSDLYKTFESLWFDKNYNQKNRYAQEIFGEKYADVLKKYGYDDYGAWLEKYGLKDTEENKKLFYEETSELMQTYNKKLADFILNNSNATIEAFIAALEKEDTVIEQGGFAAEAADRRKNLLVDLAEGELKDGRYKHLSEEATLELQKLLYADNAGTQEWADALNEFEKEYNVEIDDFDSMVFENFNTYLNNLTDNLDKEISSIDDMISKQSKGLSFKEASDYFSDFAEKGQTWDDLFEYTEDGRLIFKDLDAMIDKQYEKLHQKGEKFKENTDDLKNIIETSGIDVKKDVSSVDQWRYIEYENGTSNIASIQGFFTNVGFTPEEAAAAANWLIANQDATTEEFIAYMETMATKSEAAADFLDKNRKRIERTAEETEFESAVQNTVAILEGSFDPLKKAYQILGEKGVAGLGEEDVATLVEAGMFSLEDFSRRADGTFTLSAQAQEQLSELPLYLQTQIENTIQDTIKSAKDSITSLGGSIFSKETSSLDFVNAFTYLQTSDDFTFEDIENGVMQAIYQGVQGDTEALRKMIIREIAHKTGKSEAEVASQYGEYVDETVQETLSFYQDHFVDTIKNYNDLLYKKIVGTATFAELEELEDIRTEMGFDLSEFTGNLIDDLFIYGQAIIDNAYLSAEDKQSALENVFETSLGAKAYAEAYGIDPNLLDQDAASRVENFSSARKTMVSSKNRMDLSQAKTVAAAISNMTGIPPEIVDKLFTYNEADSTYSYDYENGAATIRDLQKQAIYGYLKDEERKKLLQGRSIENITYEEAVNAAYASGNIKAVQAVGDIKATSQFLESGRIAGLIGNESLVNETAESVKSLASGTEMTIEQIIALYQSVGKELTADELATIMNMSPEEIAQDVLKIAKDNDTLFSDADTSILEDAMNEGAKALIETLAGVVSSAVEGSASLEDLLLFSKKTGMNFVGKLIATQDGYQLTQQGAIEASALLASQDGSYTAQGYSLMESYAGKGGIFSSEQAIAEEIRRRSEKIDQINEELAKEGSELLDEERKQLEENKKLRESEKKVLESAREAYKKIEADRRAGFMENDPFNGRTAAYDSWLSNRDQAGEALKSAISNEGKLDYKQAASIIDFIGYGQNWTDEQAETYLDILRGKVDTEGNVDLLGVYRAITGKSEATWEDLARDLDASGRKEVSEQLALDEKDAKTKRQLKEAKERVSAQDFTFGQYDFSGDFNSEDYFQSLNKAVFGTEEGAFKLSGIEYENFAKQMFGDSWKEALASPETRADFENAFKESVKNYEYDPSSGLERDEHFRQYMQGAAGAVDIQTQLNNLQDRLEQITTTGEGVIQPINDGLNKAIEQAIELNSILQGGGFGTVFNVQKDDESGKLSLGLYEDESLFNEAEEQGARRRELIKQLISSYGKYEEYYGEDKEAPDFQMVDGKPTLTFEGKEGGTVTVVATTYQSKDDSGIDPNTPRTLTFVPNFEAITKEIEKLEETPVQLVLDYITPQQAQDTYDNMLSEMEAILSGGISGQDEAIKYQNLYKKADAWAQTYKLGKYISEDDISEDDGNGFNVSVTIDVNDEDAVNQIESVVTEIETKFPNSEKTIKIFYTDDKGNKTETKPDNVTQVEVVATVDNTEAQQAAESLVKNLTTLNSLEDDSISVNINTNATDADTEVSNFVTKVQGYENDNLGFTVTVTIVDQNGNSIALDDLGQWANKDAGANTSTGLATPPPVTPNTESHELTSSQYAAWAAQQAAIAAGKDDFVKTPPREDDQIAESAADGNGSNKSKDNKDNKETPILTQIKTEEPESEPPETSGEDNPKLQEKRMELAGLEAQITGWEAYVSNQLHLPGTTAEAALQLGRKWSGYTWNPEIEESVQEIYGMTFDDFLKHIVQKEKEADDLRKEIETLEQTSQTSSVNVTEGKESEVLVETDGNKDNKATSILTQTEIKEPPKTNDGDTKELDSDKNPDEKIEGDIKAVEALAAQDAFFDSGFVKGTASGLRKTVTGLEYKSLDSARGIFNPALFFSNYFREQISEDGRDWLIKEADSRMVESGRIVGPNGTFEINLPYELLAQIYSKNPDFYNQKLVTGNLLSDGQLEQFYTDKRYADAFALNMMKALISTTPEEVQSLWTDFLPTVDSTQLNSGEYATYRAYRNAQLAPFQEGYYEEIQIDQQLDQKGIEQVKSQLGAEIKDIESEYGINLKVRIVMPDNSSFIIDGYTTEEIIQGQVKPGAGQYTGNVNGIAYAEGNVDPLIAGANLANKTLVGELGPEMGVWGGQYHLLGANGAEFVDMPSNAIVFNHRQTEGILKGQSGYRGKALAQGNVNSEWKNLLNEDYFLNIVSDAKKGGDGKKVEYTEINELEEWYNLMRKITRLQAERNLLEVEYENLTSGHEQLDNIRARQKALHEEMAIQKRLLEYQREELALQRKNIEQQSFWNKSLTFNEDGTLQSIFGNELNGGRGVFAFLDQLKQLDGSAQVEMLKKIGYSAVGRDGKALEGKDLVSQFISEYTEIVGDYNDLQDTISKTESTIEENTTAVNELEQQITDNQKELEKKVYDLIVEQAEREIEVIKKQNELIKEANDKYVKGLTDALNEEKNMYESNQAISDREALQRQLSLLRRSGGSASEIAELEKQLDDTLKSEYFSTQEKMIEDITKANERQVELMERQIKIQEDSLTYQKENGVIWQQVYEVLDGSYESILDFLSGNSKEFFEASSLEQKAMLLEWAKMVGMYDEDRANKLATSDAKKQWESGEVQKMLQADTENDRWGQYQKLSSKDKTAAQEHYNTAYADARLSGMSEGDARKEAYDSMVERFRVDGDDLGIVRWDPHGKATGGGGSGGSGDYVTVTYEVQPPEAKTEGCYITGPSRIAVGSSGRVTVGTKTGWSQWGWSSSDSKIAQINAGVIKAWKKGSVVITMNFKRKTAQADQRPNSNSLSKESTYNNKTGLLVDKFSQGGLVDYTGLAMVHGSKSKPESFLNAEQTAQIREALEISGNRNMLEDVRSSLQALQSTIKSITNIANNSETSSITIAPGAVVIEVAELADSYDVDTLSADVMNRIVNIANKRTTRSVNRR